MFTIQWNPAQRYFLPFSQKQGRKEQDSFPLAKRTIQTDSVHFGSCVSSTTPRPDAIQLLLQGNFAKRQHIIGEMGNDPSETLVGVLLDYLLKKNEFTNLDPDLIYSADPAERAKLFNGMVLSLLQAYDKGKVSEDQVRRALREARDAEHIDTPDTHQLIEDLLARPTLPKGDELHGLLHGHEHAHGHHHHEHKHPDHPAPPPPIERPAQPASGTKAAGANG